MERLRAPGPAAVVIGIVALGGVALLVGLLGGEGDVAGGEPGAESSTPIVLLLHSGGFLLEDSSSMTEAEEIAEEAGFETAVVDYPLGDLEAAVRDVRGVARDLGRDGREVFAYGESAGGTLAALLAQRGLADAAAAYSPIADLVDFTSHTPDPANYRYLIHADRALLRASSPATHPSRQSILAMAPTFDSPYLNRETRAWDRGDERVRSIAVDGGHVGYGDDPAIYSANAARALGWLARRAELP